MRKIVQLKTVDSVDPIENADAIEVAKIGGWRVVAQKGRFVAGDTALYFEVDTFLPETEPLFESFIARSSKRTVSPLTNEEVRGHVLKTVKLRGVVSQGILMKPSEFGLSPDASQDEVDERMTEIGLFKWEPPLPAGGQQVGAFPGQARKTDSERVQNLSDEFLSSLDPDEWFATEKIDGTSSTFVVAADGRLIVASRNWAVSEESVQGQMAKRLEFDKILPVGSVVQGEIFGEGIQGNKLKISGTRLAIFSYNEEASAVADVLDPLMVPVLDLTLPKTVDAAIEQVDKLKSTLNPKFNAEGVVWWNRAGKTFTETGDRPNFKSINNAFLMKQKD